MRGFLASILLVVASETVIHATVVDVPRPASLITKFGPREPAVLATQCDPNVFNACSASFAHSFGLQMMPSDPEQFIQIIQKRGSTKAGFVLFCQATTQYQQCLGAQAQACTSVAFFQSLGLSATNATIYHIVYGQITFECGAAYQTIFQNYECIMFTSKKFNASLMQCGKTFLNSAEQDPENICLYAQVYLECYSDPYAATCNPQVSGTICDLVRTPLQSSIPQCNALICDQGAKMKLASSKIGNKPAKKTKLQKSHSHDVRKNPRM